MAVIFKYDAFYSYYNQPEHTIQVNPPLKIWYYVLFDKYHGYWSLQPTECDRKVMVNSTEIYITFNKDRWIFFNILRQHNNKYLGDHLSIGFKKGSKTMLGMHFTVQNEINGKANNDPQKCFLKEGMDISDVPNIKCQQPNSGYLRDYFTEDEIKILQTILQAPFTTTQVASGGYHTANYRKTFERTFIGKFNRIVYEDARRSKFVRMNNMYIPLLRAKGRVT